MSLYSLYRLRNDFALVVYAFGIGEKRIPSDTYSEPPRGFLRLYKKTRKIKKRIISIDFPLRMLLREKTPKKLWIRIIAWDKRIFFKMWNNPRYAVVVEIPIDKGAKAWCGDFPYAVLEDIPRILHPPYRLEIRKKRAEYYCFIVGSDGWLCLIPKRRIPEKRTLFFFRKPDDELIREKEMVMFVPFTAKKTDLYQGQMFSDENGRLFIKTKSGAILSVPNLFFPQLKIKENLNFLAGGFYVYRSGNSFIFAGERNNRMLIVHQE